ncbi:MAG: efflux RND transporter periplasmic adaptor subunit [Candidatus Cryptobacteroides sp.]
METIGRLTRSLLSALALAAMVSCSGNVKKKEVKAPVRVGVVTVSASETDLTRTYTGKVAASKEVVLTAPFPAKLVSCDVRKGQRVAEGQALAQLYSETVESTFSASEATLRQARDGYDRLQQVKDNGSVPAIKVVEVETALAKATATYNASAKAREDCTVKAPFAGTVSDIMAECGEELSIAQPLVRLVDLGSLEISIPVPETEIASLKVGSRAYVTVPALSEDSFPATIVSKGVSASAVSHNYECRLKLSVPMEGLMPGMIGKVRFRSPASGKNVVVPSSAVRSDKDGRYLWTVTPSETVAKKYISTGGFSGNGIVVTSGLEEGDRIITNGMSKVSTGMKVEAVPSNE